MTYWGELRQHWKPLLAATMGLGFGIGVNAYFAALFGPKLLTEFEWSRSDFALLGSLSLLMLIMQPITGRMTDRYGVRVVSAIGVLTAPLAYIGYSLMGGDIKTFFIINIMQLIFGTLTTSPVYTRIVAERFTKARGIAFSIVMTGPPLAGAIFAPILGGFIEAEGWRAGYMLAGGICLFFGLIAVALTPAHIGERHAETGELIKRPKGDYRAIIANPSFWTLIIAMICVNIPQGLTSSQLKLVLMDSGAASGVATWLISLFAIGVILGRFACGFSLDKLAPHRVAAVTLGLPAVGFLLMASPMDSAPALSFAVLTMGLAQGAEGDIGAYLVSHRFNLKTYSLVMGFVGASIAGGSALGSIILSAMLAQWDSYIPFLILSAVLTVIGAALFLTLGKHEPVRTVAA